MENIETWCMDRELYFVPKHFVVSNTPITEKSKIWILEKLHGRFSLVETIKQEDLSDSDKYNMFWADTYPAFEDPHEAVLYELTWG